MYMHNLVYNAVPTGITSVVLIALQMWGVYMSTQYVIKVLICSPPNVIHVHVHVHVHVHSYVIYLECFWSSLACIACSDLHVQGT